MARPTYHQMLLDTRNKNISGIGVGILMVFEIFGHFLFKAGRDYHVRSRCYLTQETRLYMV
jgi:hypothetical protein